MLLGLNLIVVFGADLQINKSLLSGLLAEECTGWILELPEEARD